MKNELLKNTLVVGFGRLFTQFSSVLLIPVYTRFLSPTDYGSAELIITYSALLMPFVTLSLEQGAFRMLVDARGDKAAISAIIAYVIKAPLVIFLFLLLIALAAWCVLPVSAIPYAILYAFTYIAMNVCIWIARGLGLNKVYAKGSLIVGSVLLPLSLLLVVVCGMGLSGMIIAISAANLIGAIYFFYAMKLGSCLSARTDSKIKKALLQYSVPLMPNGVSWWLINAADRTIVAVFLGSSATGLLALAVKFPAVLIAIFTVFWISWHEAASLHIKSAERDLFFSKVATSNIVLFGSIGLGILALLSVSFDFIVAPGYREAYYYVPLFMVGALLNTLATLYGSIYAAKKTTGRILRTTVIAGVVSVVVNVALVSFIGLYATGVASMAGYLVMLVFRHYDIKKYVTISLNWTKILPFIIVALGVACLYYINHPLLNWLNVVLAIVAAVVLNRGIILSVKDLLWKRITQS